MSDLIDRQALLRQIDIDSDGEPGYYGDTWKFIDTIKRMPSALSTNLAEVGTDCISRQAAIRWVKTECNPYGKPTLDFESGKKVIKHLEQMPSAQPEIVRCKDCDWWTKQEDSLQGRCALLQMYPTGGWFCGNARSNEGKTAFGMDATARAIQSEKENR